MAGERTRTVAVRLTPAEHAVWEAAAAAAGRGRLGSWVRDEMSAHLGEADSVGAGLGRAGGAPVEVDMELAAALARSSTLRTELGRVGNNLNQAVHFAYVNGVDAGVVERLEETAAQVRAVVALVHQLGAQPAPPSGSSAGAKAGSAGGGPGPRRAQKTLSSSAAAAPVNPWTTGGRR